MTRNECLGRVAAVLGEVTAPLSAAEIAEIWTSNVGRGMAMTAEDVAALLFDDPTEVYLPTLYSRRD
jgi:hypothetical protein